MRDEPHDIRPDLPRPLTWEEELSCDYVEGYIDLGPRRLVFNGEWFLFGVILGMAACFIYFLLGL